MKKLRTLVLVIVCMLNMASCVQDETTADKSDIIQFNDKVFSKSDLSQETIE